ALVLRERADLIELVYHEELDFRQLAVGVNALCREHEDVSACGFLTQLGDDLVFRPKRGKTTTSFINQCDRRHDDGDIRELARRDESIDDSAFAKTRWSAENYAIAAD